ncbi:MAG: peptidoglycan DD-metalloendopeptidase family protein [Gordonia sp. (in: high G+C Gram-positive bacteria)]|uniref:peptidoglycan DD-metalloendopeptidase family protein n=1 Tax=Gordonia sp. (in: high G+C Gram-positive bacteria) TaxID=84139 RepID=UPI0039E465B3
MTPQSQSGASTVAERRRTDGESVVTVESLMTRDIPLPPRALRIGLGDAPGPAAPMPNDDAQLPPLVVAPRPVPATAPATRSGSTAPKQARSRTESSRPAERTSSRRPAPAREVAEPPVPTDPGSPRAGRHRAGPPAALKARAALFAVAAGAAAAAVAGSGPTPEGTPITSDVPPSPPGAMTLAAAASPDEPGGVVPAASSADMTDYFDQLAVGKQLAASTKAAEAAKRKPLFAAPITAKYSFTSGYGQRWGTLHGGLDLAAPLGTPIHAVADGIVKKAGPASGYGNWIQVKHSDGTITMYGHMASSGVLVREGQHVTAGDVIGLVGSEGFSTGPHLHLEVWKNGTTKIDPAPWLAKNGIRLNPFTG